MKCCTHDRVSGVSGHVPDIIKHVVRHITLYFVCKVHHTTSENRTFRPDDLEGWGWGYAQSCLFNKIALLCHELIRLMIIATLCGSYPYSERFVSVFIVVGGRNRGLFHLERTKRKLLRI